MKHEIKNSYTRKIDKAYNDKLLEWATTKREWGSIVFMIQPSQIGAANDVLIKMMYWLTDTELEALSMPEYKQMLVEAKKSAGIIDNKDPL